MTARPKTLIEALDDLEKARVKLAEEIKRAFIEDLERVKRFINKIRGRHNG